MAKKHTVHRSEVKSQFLQIHKFCNFCLGVKPIVVEGCVEFDDGVCKCTEFIATRQENKREKIMENKKLRPKKEWNKERRIAGKRKESKKGKLHFGKLISGEVEHATELQTCG